MPPDEEELCMTTSEQLDRISSILAAAPAWARAALTSADERQRSRGADELSALVLRKIADPVPVCDENQLSLPIAG
jgi:hypothetical protein